MAALRGIPTSRAYWELRAEQVLNRVFSPDAAIEVEICDPPAAPPPPAELISTTPAAASPAGIPLGAASQIAESPIPASARPQVTAVPSAARQASAGTATRGRSAVRPSRLPRPAGTDQQPTTLILASVSLTVTVVAGLGLLGLNVWNQSQQAMRQERNMLMIERLRSMGPSEAQGQPAVDPAAANASTAAAGEDGSLPPPPPAEPWMEELATLPASSAPPANVLKVPMSSRVSSPAPAASGSGRSSSGSSRSGGASPSGGGDAPQLVGVVQAQGHGGSAIFQIGNASTSAAVGESIGSTGWRLRAATGDSAVIERGGEQRRVSISGGS